MSGSTSSVGAGNTSGRDDTKTDDADRENNQKEQEPQSAEEKTTARESKLLKKIMQLRAKVEILKIEKEEWVNRSDVTVEDAA